MEKENNISWNAEELKAVNSISADRLTTKTTYQVSRDLAKLNTERKITKGNNGLYDKIKKYNLDNKSKMDYDKLLSTKGIEFFSTAVDGIAINATASKVLLALCSELSEQSEASDTVKYNIGIDPEKYEIFHIENTKAEPTIIINLYEFAKKINGSKVSRLDKTRKGKVNKDDKNQYRAILDMMASYTICTECLTFHLIDKIVYMDKKGDFATNKDNAVYAIITLNDIFCKGIGINGKKNFLSIRKIDSTILAGEKKDIVFRLYFLLLVEVSYKNKSIYKISKAELIQRIAILKSYDRQKGLLARDLNHAIEVMKKLQLIQEYKEGVEANTRVEYSYFTLNNSYEKLLPAPAYDRDTKQIEQS